MSSLPYSDSCTAATEPHGLVQGASERIELEDLFSLWFLYTVVPRIKINVILRVKLRLNLT